MDKNMWKFNKKKKTVITNNSNRKLKNSNSSEFNANLTDKKCLNYRKDCGQAEALEDNVSKALKLVGMRKFCNVYK